MVTTTALVSRSCSKKFKSRRNHCNSQSCLSHLAKSGLKSLSALQLTCSFLLHRCQAPNTLCLFRAKLRLFSKRLGCQNTPLKESYKARPGPVQSNENIPLRESKNSLKFTLEHMPAWRQSGPDSRFKPVFN